MKQHVELYNKEKHYEMLKAWWDKHEKGIICPEILGLGVVAFLDDEPCAAVFGYLDRYTVVGMIEFAVSNPDAAPKKVFRALEIATEGLVQVMEQTGGACLIIGAFAHRGIRRVLSRAGFQDHENVVTQLKIKGYKGKIQ